jgi:hypothetical protein
MVVTKMSPDSLKKQIDEYFGNLGEGVFPDYAGMLLDIGLFPDEVQELCNPETNKRAHEYSRVFQYAELKRESWLARVAASDSRLAAGAFNLLKQEKNGGYTTASAPNKGNTLRVVVDSLPGGAEALK